MTPDAAPAARTGRAAGRDTDDPAAPPAFDPDMPWALDPRVSLRPEPFGALAYHFGNRRLAFVKSPTLLSVVRGLDDHPSARAACRAAGVGDDELARHEQALAALAARGMLVPRDEP